MLRRLHVTLDTAAVKFPPCCPCCRADTDPGAVLTVTSEDGRLCYELPACRTCARHNAIGSRMLTIVLASGISAAAALVVKLRGFMTLLLMVGRPMELLAFAAIVLAFGLVFWGLFWVLMRPLSNKGCAALCDLLKVCATLQPPKGVIFSFDNAEYGRLFAQTNS